MKRLSNFIMVLAIAALIGCVDKIPLSKENKVFAGKWITNDGTWIQLYNDGGGSFQKSNSSVKGGAAVIADGTIKIGMMGINSTYTIHTAPHEREGHWEMELDGNIYVKESVSYQ